MRGVDLQEVSHARLQILSDNSVIASSKNVLGEHGFSVLITSDRGEVLFDTGQTGRVLINNLNVMKGGEIKIKSVVLSHGHYDHSGGLLTLVRRASDKCEIYAHPMVFYRRFKKIRGEIKDIGMPFSKTDLEDAGVILRLTSEARVLNKWLLMTGTIERSNSFEKSESEFYIEVDGRLERDPFLDDQAIAFNVKGKGTVVVTGCAHSGVVNTMEYVKKILAREEVYAVVGGFHLNDASQEKLKNTVDALRSANPKIIIPCHCTGRDAIYLLREKFGGAVVYGEAGLTIEL